VTECQLGAEFLGERPHRLVLRAGRDPQGAVTPGAGLRDQLFEQDAADAQPTLAGFDAKGDLGE
jgi:hypothetical protein